jgi:hypothetical protein
MPKEHHDDVEMVDSKGNVTGNVGKNVVVIDGKEVPYDEAFKKVNEKDAEDKTDD